MTPKPSPNGTLVFRLLSAHPYPVASDLRLSLDGVCRFGLDGVTWCFRDDGWHVLADTFAHHLPAADHVTAKLLHAEIGRVRALVDGESSPTWAEIKADCVGPDLPADDPLYDRAAAEQALAKVTAERDQARQAYLDLSTDNPLRPTVNAIAERLSVCPAEPGPMLAEIDRLKGLADAHTVVSQRLVGSQKEVAERDATIDNLRSALETIAGHVGADPWAVEEIKVKVAEVVVKAGAVPALEKCVARLTEERDRARFTGQRLTHAAQNACRVLTDAGVAPPIKSDPATKAEARVKRLRKSINAAHDVLDEAGIGLEPEGSPRWTLARRCRAAVAPVWGYLDAMQAFDVVGEIVGVTGKTGERGFIDAVIARVKALHQEDADLLRLVSYHQAPIKFNNRPLTLAERAAFVIRRLWQGRTNAAAEAAALRRELGDIADALGDLPDTAEREPIGDREEHLGLSTAERIWLSR